MIIKDNLDIYMRRGDTEAIRVGVKRKVGVDDITLQPIMEPVALVPGDIVYLTVKDAKTLDVNSMQIVVSNFTGGEALINIRPEDTKPMDIGTYVYDIQLTRANGEVKTIIPFDATVELPKFFIRGEVTYD